MRQAGGEPADVRRMPGARRQRMVQHCWQAGTGPAGTGGWAGCGMLPGGLIARLAWSTLYSRLISELGRVSARLTCRKELPRG
jgi:hypothetical protein